MKIRVTIEKTYDPQAPYRSDTKITASVEDDRAAPPTVGAVQALTKLTTDIAGVLR